MKTKIFKLLQCAVFFAAVCLLSSCKEEPTGQQPTDSQAPDPVTLRDPQSKSIPGGAVIYYTLPADEDLLYVKAVYSRSDGVERDVRASVYVDSLVIEGFGDTISHQVQLIAVDRSRNESSPTPVAITPGKPAVLSIAETVILYPDFGGITAEWSNPMKAEIIIPIMTKNQNGDFVPIEIFYSASTEGKGTVLNLTDTIDYDIITFVEDRWGNRSGEINLTLTPLYTVLLDRTKMGQRKLTNDPNNVGGWEVSNLFNGTQSGNGFSTIENDINFAWPHWVTIDLGVTAKLSRMRLFQRGDRNDVKTYHFWEGNLKEFEVWGCHDNPPEANGNWDHWDLLAPKFTSVKPSGLPQGELSDDDVRVAEQGEDFIFPATDENFPVRYIRIKCLKPWSGGNNMQMGELMFWGNDRIE
ncbi:MAG: DUF4959 domain-containing protein [Bacteroidales bacterium]|jgi:hypothetical protein|nr:DUF4959 domain-containing protein [Bacteroidales bacterium]